MKPTDVLEIACTKLIQKNGHPMIDFGCGGWRNRPYSHLCPAPNDDFFAVGGNEFVEHYEMEYPSHRCTNAVHKSTVRKCVLFATASLRIQDYA